MSTNKVVETPIQQLNSFKRKMPNFVGGSAKVRLHSRFDSKGMARLRSVPARAQFVSNQRSKFRDHLTVGSGAVQD